MPDGAKQLAASTAIATTAASMQITAQPGSATAALVDMREQLHAAEERARAQQRKCDNLSRYFGAQLRQLTEQLRAERRSKAGAQSPNTPHPQPSPPIVDALLRFESKLRNEQTAIRQQMHDKDAQLNRLHRELQAMRERHGAAGTPAAGDGDVDRVAQFCPACRKQYHLVGTKPASVQTDGSAARMVNGSTSAAAAMDNGHEAKQTKATSTAGTSTTDTSSTHSIEYLSSSEEGTGLGLGCSSLAATSFLEARRSKKYMSKRTSGTFRDYLRSRSIDPQILGTEQSTINVDSSSPHHGPSTNGPVSAQLARRLSDVSHRSMGGAASVAGGDQRRSILKPVAAVRRANSLHCNNKTPLSSPSSSSSMSSSFSSSAAASGNRSSSNSSTGSCGRRSRSQTESGGDHQSPPKGGSPISQLSRLSDRENTIDESMEVVGEADNGGGIAIGNRRSSGGGDFDDEVFSEEVRDDHDTAANTTGGFESTDDWYASVSDMEEDSDPVHRRRKSYGYNAVNPVLECVNQILLQQSMDCTLEPTYSSSSAPASPDQPQSPVAANAPISNLSPTSPKSTLVLSTVGAASGAAPTPTTTKSQKRVHFSTQNSMVQVPRADDSFYYIEPLVAPTTTPYDMFYQHQYEQEQQQRQQPPSAAPQTTTTSSHSHHQHQLSYESVYSNEYEPIGSEGACSVATTNHYVDMDAKSDRAPPHQHSQQQSHAQKMPNNVANIDGSGAHQQPPALPPKPSNLLRIRNVPRQPAPPAATQGNNGNGSDGSETEPDYASILEIGPLVQSQRAAQQQQPMQQQVVVVADVHHAAAASDTTASSVASSVKSSSLIAAELQSLQQQRNGTQFSFDVVGESPSSMSSTSADDDDDDDASFADVPRLPNVAAIISPKKEPAVTPPATSVVATTPDNYITRNSAPAQHRLPSVAEHSQMTDTKTSTLSKNIQLKNLHNRQQQPIKPSAAVRQTPATPLYEDKLRIQAEFDWYNLDVEYSGVRHRPDDRNNAKNNEDHDADDDDAKATDSNSDDSNSDGNGNAMDASSSDPQSSFVGVEYKLDEEFHLNGLGGGSPYSNEAGCYGQQTSSNYNGRTGSLTSASSMYARETIPEDDRDEDEDEDDEGVNEEKEGDVVVDNLSTTSRRAEQHILPPITPKMRVSAADAFETFLSETGLATKPLPRKRRIFY